MGVIIQNEHGERMQVARTAPGQREDPGEAVSFARRNVLRQHTVSILSSSSTCPLALLYIDSLCT